MVILWNEMTDLIKSWLTLRDYAHFAHVNVQGGHFFTLHHQFEELYIHALENADSVAERYKQLNPDIAVQMNGQEVSYNLVSDRDFVQEIIAHLAEIREQQNTIWANTNSTGDYVTNDLMVQLSKYVDFTIWQFSEFLK